MDAMKPSRDPKYLGWIRTQPCLICLSTSQVEAAHTGPHGISQKASDRAAVPLCIRHHRNASNSYHSLGKNFGAMHGIDLHLVTRELNRKPSIRVQGGRFVAFLDGAEVSAGSIQDGIRSAVRSALKQLCADRISDLKARLSEVA